MKRSDMIQMMYNHLRDNHFGQYGEFHKMCESLLDRMEDEGMLPPSTKLSHFHKDDCQSYDGDDCSCGGISDNAWEPEDE